MVPYFPSPRDHYWRNGVGGSSLTWHRGRGRSNGSEHSRPSNEEISKPAFIAYKGFDSWSELKKKWSEDRTITIEDEDNILNESAGDNSEVQVVKESLTPLISLNEKSNLSDTEIYKRLMIIKSASDKTIRSRKIDYSLSYEIYPISQQFKKSNPGVPVYRVYVLK